MMNGGLTGTLYHLINGWFSTFGYGGVALAMAIESCCIPLPSELIMPLAGFFVLRGNGNMNLVGVTVAGGLGCLIGSLVAYLIGFTGGRPLLLRYGRYILISHDDADRADRYFARYGDATIFFTRLMPIVRTFISLPAGITRMNIWKFALFTFAGSLPWCFVLALAGYKLGERWDSVANTLHKYEILVGIVIVALLALFIYRHVKRPASTVDA